FSVAPPGPTYSLETHLIRDRIVVPRCVVGGDADHEGIRPRWRPLPHLTLQSRRPRSVPAPFEEGLPHPCLGPYPCDERACRNHEHLDVNGGLATVIEDGRVPDGFPARTNRVERHLGTRLNVSAAKREARRLQS